MSTVTSLRLTDELRIKFTRAQSLLSGLAELLERSQNAFASCEEADTSACYAAIVDAAMQELRDILPAEFQYEYEDAKS